MKIVSVSVTHCQSMAIGKSDRYRHQPEPTEATAWGKGFAGISDVNKRHLLLHLYRSI
jgi:hypothetical protein